MCGLVVCLGVGGCTVGLDRPPPGPCPVRPLTCMVHLKHEQASRGEPPVPLQKVGHGDGAAHVQATAVLGLASVGVEGDVKKKGRGGVEILWGFCVCVGGCGCRCEQGTIGRGK